LLYKIKNEKTAIAALSTGWNDWRKILIVKCYWSKICSFKKTW